MIEMEEVTDNAVDLIWIVYKRIKPEAIFAIIKVTHEISFAFFVRCIFIS